MGVDRDVHPGTTARTTGQRLKIVLQRIRMPEFGRQCAEYAVNVTTMPSPCRRNPRNPSETVCIQSDAVVCTFSDGQQLPGEISGGMRQRAGLARALVLDPQLILCDAPDSGLDPVRRAYLSQLLIDINAQIDATILIVTHNISVARTVPDNIGMLFRKHLVMFGPGEVLLTSA